VTPIASPAPSDVLAAVSAATSRGGPLHLDVRWYPTVASTMNLAADAAQANASEGLVIVAGEQTEGRGRRGRVWSSPPGAGLYLTFLFRPSFERATPLLGLLTLAAGVGVRDAVGRGTGFWPALKWPNDVMVGRRKLAGILSEGHSLGTAEQSVLVGVGINLLNAAHPPDVAARMTSLEAELGRVVDRAALLEELLVALPRAYDALRGGDADGILRTWREASPSAVGQDVEWHSAAGVMRGTTAGIDAAGALLVTTPQGTERLVGGELTWI
jgi:BirA family biotin operon repressor/biotin-[acetyl-CoA-carboxylase] ligase